MNLLKTKYKDIKMVAANVRRTFLKCFFIGFVVVVVVLRVYYQNGAQIGANDFEGEKKKKR